MIFILLYIFVHFTSILYNTSIYKKIKIIIVEVYLFLIIIYLNKPYF